jgi:predicted NBD/HSP70 family sugar kinase
VEPAKPSPELLRSLTDEHVLQALMRQRRLTRAELANITGISKPAVGDSVRRLAEAGLVVDTGERTAGGRGRGRVGAYYALAVSVGAALALSIAPEGIVAECVDAHGDTVSRAEKQIHRLARPEELADALRSVAVKARQDAKVTARLAVVSAAGPVDRATGRLIQLPDEPFLLGELDPIRVLAPHVDGPVVVDNDVNWAAQAERDNARGVKLNDFAYLFLGEGLGAAVVSDGKIIRGHAGFAGEIAHLITVGPQGEAMRLIEVFSVLGLRRPGATAIDTGRLLTAATGPQPHAAAVCRALSQAVGGVLAAAVALTDSQQVIIGGSWGSHPVILAAISAAAARIPRPVPVQAAEVAAEPALAGARTSALTRLRSAIIVGRNGSASAAGDSAGRRSAGVPDHHRWSQ